MSTLREYKGYVETMDYSAEDRILHGKIAGIRDSVLYEGNDVNSLEKNFHAAVDEYLKSCESQGKQPDQIFK